MPSLVICLFGFPRIELDGAAVETDRRKAIALLAYLALNGGRSSRETLEVLFWPDYSAAQAAAYLRRTLWEIKQMLGEGWLSADREMVTLYAGESGWVDVVAFQALVQAGLAGRTRVADLEQAVALYRDDFLSGFTLRDSPGFDDWQGEQAGILRCQLGQALQALAQAYQAGKQLLPAVEAAQRWLKLDPLDETALGCLLDLYAQAGQRSQALRLYDEYVRRLRSELNAVPSAELVARYRQLKSDAFKAASGKEKPAGLPAVEKPAGDAGPGSPAAPGEAILPHLNLPVPPTPFVGRQRILEQIAVQLADPSCRLLALVGPGGVGKTRLSIQAASGQLANYPDGIYFVSLAPLADPNLLVSAVVDALRLPLRSVNPSSNVALEDVKAQLLDYLRAKQMLLVMDNFEHILDGAGLLSEILAAAPCLKILATSRERLNLAEEWALDVPGMSYPGKVPDGVREGELAGIDLETYGAVKLFVQSARRARVGFTPRPGDWAAISNICRLVDGLPLGIELAAAWVKLMSCAEIESEIARNLDFLTSPLRGVPERHRSLRAVFEYSWKLLSEKEQCIFCHLSVFRGGFGQAAAQAVASASLADLADLMDKSFLQRSLDGRYYLHEVMRQYGAAMLDNSPQQAADARLRHAYYYLQILTAADHGLKGARMKNALDTLSAEGENIRVAWAWAVEHDDLDLLRDAFTSLFLFYDWRHRYREGQDAISLALEKVNALQVADHQRAGLALLAAQFMSALRIFLYHQDQQEAGRAYARRAFEILQHHVSEAYEIRLGRAMALLLLDFFDDVVSSSEAQQYYEEAVTFFRSQDMAWETAVADMSWAEHGRWMRIEVERIQLLLQSLETFSALGNPWGIATCHNNLAHAYYWAGNLPEAKRCALVALEMYQEMGEEWWVASTRFNLGLIATSAGEFETAKSYYQMNVAFLRQIGQRGWYASHLDCLGYLEFLQHQYDAAETYYRQSYDLYRQLNDTGGAVMAFNNLGDVTLARGDTGQARQFFQQALDLMETWSLDWLLAITNKNLARTDLMEGKLAETQGRLRQALQYAMHCNNIPEILDVLSAWGAWLAETGQFARAVELLACVSANVNLTHAVRTRVNEHLAVLEALMSAGEYMTAVQRGKASTLQNWLEVLL